MEVEESAVKYRSWKDYRGIYENKVSYLSKNTEYHICYVLKFFEEKILT